MIFKNLCLVYLLTQTSAKRNKKGGQERHGNINGIANSKGKGTGGGGGYEKPKFKLQGGKAGGSDRFKINVREVTSAVTASTSILSNGGAKKYINEDDMATILVNDSDEEIDGVIAVIAVDKKTDDVNGYVEKAGKKMKFTQKKGKEVSAILFMHTMCSFVYSYMSLRIIPYM